MRRVFLTVADGTQNTKKSFNFSAGPTIYSWGPGKGTGIVPEGANAAIFTTARGAPELTYVKETTEEILKKAGMSKWPMVHL